MSGPGERLAFRLLAIGDRRQATAGSVAAAAAAGGPGLAVLLREPELTDQTRLAWALQLLPTCRAHGALLLVHGSPVIAHEAGADGVHLPARGPTVEAARAIVGPSALVGLSCHDLTDVLRAASAGADYATLSPIAASPGKGPALGIEALASVCGMAPLPLVALGGITPERVPDCLRAGAAAVAAIRAVWEGDVAENVRRLLGEMQG